MYRVIRTVAPLAVTAAAVALVAVPAAATTQHARPAHRAGSAANSASSASGLVRHLRHVEPGVHPAASRGGSRVNNEQSENWSGYIKSGSGISSSTANWTVPSVSTQYDGYSSTWVGVDGASSGDQYLIQTGTEQDVEGGSTNYDAWWEVITPSDEAPEVVYSSLDISPGDSISASVTNDGNGDWTMSLTDNSTGRTGTHTAAFAGPGDSAEWIQEDTDVNGSISSAPDWGSVSFDGITVDGGNPGLSSAAAVDIVDSQGTQEDSTGAPNGSNDGFTVTWLAPGTPTPTTQSKRGLRTA